jgi:hypothetical protein
MKAAWPSVKTTFPPPWWRGTSGVPLGSAFAYLIRSMPFGSVIPSGPLIGPSQSWKCDPAELSAIIAVRVRLGMPV